MSEELSAGHTPASEIALRVEGLGKRYKLGVREEAADSFREALMSLLTAPLRRLRHLGESTRNEKLFWALEDVSFEVPRGEVLGIIGHNGAGKSTLLKVLSRITDPTVGRALIRGRVGSLLEVGTGFHPELSGRENIYLSGAILGMRKAEIERKLDEIVAFAEIEQFIETPVKRYSSGMYVRLAFAVAAHLEPEVLIVDEVLAVGDAEFQKKCLRAMDRMHQGGRTVIFVSHNMGAIENLCSRCLWIDRGRIRMDGHPREVIKQYLSASAGSYGSSVSLEHIEAREGEGQVRFTGVDFLDREGLPLDVVRAGQDLTLRLHYRVAERVSNPHFGVEIHNDLGTLVTNLNTWHTGLEIPELLPGEGWLDLDLDFLNLMPDRYYLSLWLESPGNQVYDRMRHCAALDVEVSDFYGTGKGITNKLGLAFFGCRWRLGGPGPAATPATGE